MNLFKQTLTKQTLLYRGLTKKFSNRTSFLLLGSTRNFKSPFYKTSCRFSSNDDIHPDFQKQVKVDLSDKQKLLELVDQWVRENKVVLFMKGTKEMPRCGFSNYLVQVMNFYKIKDFKDVNVLESEVLRETVKEYSNWPTYPQLYINGELIGGCDIVKQMHESGALEELVTRENLI